MKKLLFVLPLALGGCYQLTDQQGTLLTEAVTVGLRDICVYGEGQYAKVAKPSNLQKAAKASMDAACADPNASSQTIVAAYNELAKLIGGKQISGS